MTRVRWVSVLNDPDEFGAVRPGPPAVAADGTIYVVGRSPSGNEYFYWIDPLSGVATRFGWQLVEVLDGPLVYDASNGTRWLVTWTVTGLLAFTNASTGFTYFYLALDTGVGGLPAVSDSGRLYVPTFSLSGVGSSLTVLNGDRTLCGEVLVPANLRGASVAVGPGSVPGYETAVMVTANGTILVANCSAACLCTIVRVGPPAFGLSRSGPISATANAVLVPIGEEIYWFASNGWLGSTLAVPGLSAGPVHDGFVVVAGGGFEVVGAPISGPDAVLLTRGQGPVHSLSVGEGGMVYAVVGDPNLHHVAAYDSAAVETWSYPELADSFERARSGSTPVITPEGMLYVPTGNGKLVALVTDSVGNLAGWRNTHGGSDRRSALVTP